MSHNHLSKMFNVLVLGSSALIHTCPVEADPIPNQRNKKKQTKISTRKNKQNQKVIHAKTHKPVAAQPRQLQQPQARVINHNEPHCQIEVTLHEYNDKGHSQSQTKICLDQKSESEIIEFIKESRKNTCQTPFCGCWLG